MSVNKSIVIQKERLAKLFKAESNYKKSPKDRITRGYIETRLENVDALWKEFNQEHFNIYGLATTEEIKTQEYFVKGIYDIFEETYTHFKGCLKEALRGTGDVFEEAQGSMESQSVVEKHRSSEVKLPKIELPKFCGKYEDWQQYFDLFTSLIHKNRSLSAVEKLHYLKSTLSGEAEVLIRNLPTTDLNYDAAWKKLIARYNNKSKPSSPDWSEIENLSLADPGFISPGRIDVLLGAEVYGDIILNDIIKHPEGHLLAQNTIFGWIISGKVPQGAPTDVTKMVSLNIQVKEDFLLKQFWELENELNSIQKKLSKMKEKCEEFFDLTTSRNKEGRFVVRLPFNSDDPECQYGGLKEIAQKRFYLLEKKLQKNPKLKEEYGKVMQEYLDLGHMREIKDETIHPKAVYFPHHAVVREDRETTKLRVVFDASCKGANGVSLNDNLLIGPKLQQDLRHILMRWRRFPICIVADIVKMYRQVRIHDDDTRFQRILWRFNPDEPLGQFELLTLTFGTACAPHLAVKSLQRLADDEQLNYPTASEITKRDFYVDDLMTCCETEEEAIQIYTEMNKLMEAGGFQLQKWSSNNKVLLQFIDQYNQKPAPSIHIKADNMVKVLGICWNRDSDEFQYTVELHEVNKSPTKRQVLSDIARIYDPMGWIAPVVLTAKIFIQKLWKSGLSWDDELPENLLHEWLKYKAELSELKTIFIPRWLNFNQGCEVELHAFADASQMAYAGVVYFRTINSNGEIHVHLLTSKTKVAPIEKQLSIPRLELCGAVLAAKLLNEVAQVMNVPKHRLYAWTDSTVVLAWLRGLPSRWTTFVSNRVSEILNIIDSSQFNHVGTKFNPADCASRGLQPSDLKREKLWWSGPIFLYERNITFSKLDYTTQEETRASNSQKIKTLVALKKRRRKSTLDRRRKEFLLE
ncbi:uncharacterized protein LOC132904333 [Amyelois transitella]|uniref:uncharacterized protein LOC132904333 n=1 Tax=Amyelois transitella TaxID=680683 RepID=UPI0029905A52|nr:uncharacterized protein LOC132904333 [Amyelois transitella]